MVPVYLKRSIPLWSCLAGFLVYFGVLVYSERYHPGDTGLRSEFSEGAMRVVAVSSNSPSSRAGIVSGDLVLAVDKRPIRTWEDWRYLRATREIGHPYQFKIRRPEGLFEIPVVLGRQPGDTVSPLEPKRYVQGGLLLFAAVLIFLGTHEPVRLVGAWLLASIGTAPLFPDAEMTAIWRGLPTMVGALLWIPQLSHFMLLPLFFTFFALLPRSLFKANWPWTILWLPALLITAWGAPRLYVQIYHPSLVQEFPAWVRFVLGAGVILYGGGGLAALVTNYRRSGVQVRARFRVLIFGVFVGLAPLILFLAAIFWGTLTQSTLVWFFVSDAYRHTLVGLFVAFPISLAYAIVRHRVLRKPPKSERKAGARRASEAAR